jgi:hypothetical protein
MDRDVLRLQVRDLLVGILDAEVLEITIGPSRRTLPGGTA